MGPLRAHIGAQDQELDHVRNVDIDLITLLMACLALMLALAAYEAACC